MCVTSFFRTMNISIDYISRKFCEYNLQMFAGELPPIEIRISPARSFVGKLRYQKRRKIIGGWSYSDFQLIISNRFELPERIIEDTIIHEMIHYHIMYRGLKDTSSHGVIFKEIMTRINNKFNRHISISVRLPEETLKKDMKRRNNLLCVSRFNDGRVGITVAAQTRFLYLWKHLPLIPNVVSCTWYISENPFFNKFPRSITVKIYRITQSELDANLTDAQPLERYGNTWTM